MSNLIDLETLEQFPENEFSGIRNFITTEQLNQAIIDGDEDGLILDLNQIADPDTGLITLLDDTTVDPNNIYGQVYVGPFPFEDENSTWNAKRHRERDSIENGVGTIETTNLTEGDHNSEGYSINEEGVIEGVVAIRATLYEVDGDGNRDRVLGDNVSAYDTYTAFRLEDTNGNGELGDEGDTTVKLASFIEPPAVNMIRSDDPTSMIISFVTAEEIPGTVEVEGVGTFESDPALNHAVSITGLSPDTEYTYQVTIGEEDNAVTFSSNQFTTAPEAGQLPSDGSIKTMFLGDSREGVPEEGQEAFMGVNADTLDRALNKGWQEGSDLLVFGGDLINGYTTSPDDYRTQFTAFKQTAAPFRAQSPMYAAMGNHESLLRNYDDGSRFGISIDRFDENGSYETESSEAIFADEFIHPTNGPEPSNPDRPPYEENVYSFQYGNTKYLSINNNYWVSYNSDEVGGAPEGYMFQDQLEWIEQELEDIENDPTVDYAILYFQEPPFPNGGHSNDAMWYSDLEVPEGERTRLSLQGDNNVRAHTFDSETGELVPEEKGILEVRDQFARMVADSSKVAAVMAGDEHSYHRVLIDDQVPVGDITQDDTDGDGIVGNNGEELSPLSDLENPVWYLTVGTAGAPYYSEEITPWQQYWNEQDNPEAGFKYSSLEGTLIFDADDEGIAMEFYSLEGELIDRIDNLMDVKNGILPTGEDTVSNQPQSFEVPDNTFTYETAQEEPEDPAREPIIDVEALGELNEVEAGGIRNYITTDQLNAAITDGDENGLILDLNRIADPDTGLITLLDGSTVDPSNIYGTVFVGPYPFESAETEWNSKRLRRGQDIEEGQGLINTTYLISGDHNSEGWFDEGIVSIRATIFEEREGEDRILGDNVSSYDTFTAFRLEDTNDDGELGNEGDTTRKLASFIEPPAVNMIRSDDPSNMVITFETVEPVNASVDIEGIGTYNSDAPATRHFVPVTGLSPDTDYTYQVTIGEGENASTMPASTFTSAPEAGELPSDGSIETIFLSDSREGRPEEGLEAFMGVNEETLNRTLNQGWQDGGDLMIFGGDLINGYTTSPDDFRTQLDAFKQTVAPFRAQSPVYAAMGNHEALLERYEGEGFIALDRTDENGGYDTQSAEFVFADELVHPNNGPEPSDPNRPTYDENVYSFQYGNTKYLSINNNYWVSYASDRFGGAPEGYMFQDQLEWIEQELEDIENDPTVDYAILYFQEPPFPNGGHSNDAMWYSDLEVPEGERTRLSLQGDNNVRAHTFDSETGELIPEEKGILEVRDQLARMVAENSKVAAVMAADEHSYHRVLIDDQVPVGDITQDDTDGDGIVGNNGDGLSPLSDLENPVWYITVGTAGAPYYSEEITPWQQYWNEQDNPEAGFKYTSQEGTLVFNADENGIGIQFRSMDGEVIDQIDNLMAVKQDATAPAAGAPAFGSLEADTLEAGVDFAGEGNLVFSGAGNDIVDASTVNSGNRLYGGSDNDELLAGNNDRLFGGAGDDVLDASVGTGDNRLYGGLGNDDFFGGSDDRLVGDEGDDRFFTPEGGNNVITGGAGADQFWIANAQIPESASTITDFTAGEDVLGIGGIDSVAEFADLTITQEGADALISAGDSELARLLGINADDLTADQFAIVDTAV